MARGSDIDFAKLALIFDFAKKEELYKAIRETALLQELAIYKKLPHIAYERGLLTLEQIHAILWALLCLRRITWYPSHIVYEFTKDDDQSFLEKATIPVGQILEEIRTHADSSVHFSQEALIYCSDIRKKLKEKNFDRTLLSILNSKGYLTGKYRQLVPDIEKRKVVISHPKYKDSSYFRRKCESRLFNALLKKRVKLTEEQEERAFAIWEEAVDKYKLNIRYSEILYYLGFASRSELYKTSVVLLNIAGVRQTLRLRCINKNIFEHVHNNPKYQKIQQYYAPQVKELQNKGLEHFDIGNMLVHKKIIDGRSQLSSQEKKWAQEDRGVFLKTLIPFSINTLERELASYYIEERVAARKRSKSAFDDMVQEWTQTHPIGFSPAQDIKVQKPEIVHPALEDIAQSKRTIKIVDNTEYMPLGPKPQQKEPSSEEVLPEGISHTDYIPLNTSRNELKVLSQKIAEEVENPRSVKTLLWAIFVVHISISIIMSKLGVLFSGSDKLAIYSGLSTLVMCMPAIFFGGYLGRLADKGKVHWLFVGGFFTCALITPLLPLFFSIYIHLILRFIQASGLIAVYIGTNFCIGRWYGPAERGRMLGITTVVSSVGATIGFILSAIFASALSIEDNISDCLIASVFASSLILISLYWVYKIRTKATYSEDVEDENISIPIPKEPLVGIMLYGIVEVGLIGVFIPTYKEMQSAVLSAEVLVGYLSIGSLISSYVCGRLSDRVGAVPILKILAVIAIIALFSVPYVITDPSVQLSFFLIGVVLGAMYPLGFAWLLEIVDNEHYFGIAAGNFSLYQGAGAVFGCLFCSFVLYMFKVPMFFLLLTIVFAVYFYMLLIGPTREVEDLDEVRGILRLLKT